MLIRTVLITVLLLAEGGHTHPVVFQKNKGLAPKDVRYLLKTAAYQLDFKRAEIALHYKSSTLRMRPAGPVNKLLPEGHGRLDGLIRYINEDEEDKQNIPRFASMRYDSLYSGIDLVFYVRQSKLDADFVVAPGADPPQIRVAIEGADRIEVDDMGDILLQSGSETLRVRHANAFQVGSAGKRQIDLRYQVSDSSEIRCFVGDYDHSLPLIIQLLPF